MSIDETVRDLPLWKRALFASFMTLLPLVGLLAIEGGTRAYYWARYGVQGKRYGIWRPDQELGAIHRANAYNSLGETNDRGFRNRENVLDPKPSGSLRVIAYGGSTTFCYQLHNDEAWPARLEQLMRSRRAGGGKDQVLNAGAVMWSIGHSYARARHDIPSLAPDYVLIYSGVNEDWNARGLALEGSPMDALVRQGRFGAFTKRLDQVSWIKRELFSYKFYEQQILPRLHSLLAVAGVSSEREYPTEADPAIEENYLHVIGDMIKLSKDHGATPVFIVEITGDPSVPGNTYLTLYSRSGAKAAAEMGALVIDPSPILEGEQGGPKSLFQDTGMHYNERGARKFAAFLYDRLFGSGPAGHS